MAGLPLVKQSGLRFNTGIGPRDGVRRAAAAGGGPLQMMLYDGDGWSRAADRRLT